MKIILSPEVAVNLEAVVREVGHQEFSGVGFVEIVNGDIYVYEVAILNVGTGGYSEIPSEKLSEALKDRTDKDHVRLWFHRHPIEGWSSTDLDTIHRAPLGGIPELVRWSASIVRTPTRWIGRVDNHIKKTHVVATVEPNIDAHFLARAKDLLADYWNGIASNIRGEDVARFIGASDQSFYQPSFLDEPVETEIDDWLDVAYLDDEEQGWEVCEDAVYIEKLRRRIPEI